MSSEDEGTGSGVSGSAALILIVGGSANCLIRWDLLSGNRCALEKDVLLPRGGLQICRCECQWERRDVFPERGERSLCLEAQRVEFTVLWGLPGSISGQQVGRDLVRFPFSKVPTVFISTGSHMYEQWCTGSHKYEQW